MQKIKFLLTLILSVSSLYLMAQTRTITGKVTDAKDNMGIPGASVSEKGTTNATAADDDGNYTITVKSSAAVLIFKSIGMTTKEVVLGPSNVLNVSLVEDAKLLDEVVVTAFNVKRSEQSLGYSTQKIDGASLLEAKSANFVNNLQGKVAGVQITGSSNLGGSSRIILRGIRSITGENQPLFVVDGVPMNNNNITTADQARGALGYDYGNAIQDLNPEDIESIDVLKGATASALYGSQGANGVIMITTKKGTARKATNGKSPLGISVGSGISWSKVALLPDYQNRYGGGASPEFITSDWDTTKLRSEFEYDGSWGPELLGQEVLQWDAYYPELANYGKATPWIAHPDNVKDFFRTGLTTNNSIALDGGNETSLFRIGFTNFRQTGTMDNSKLTRNSISFNGSHKFSNRFTTTIGANYVKTKAKGRPETGYNNLTSNFTQWWQRQLDIEALRDYKNSDGSQRTWNMVAEDDPSPYYWNNPFWTLYENYETDSRDRIYGNISMTYKLNDWLSLIGNAKTDFYNEGRQERIAVGSVDESKYSEEVIKATQNNFDLMLNGQKALNKDWDLTAFVGLTRQDKTLQDDHTTTQGGLNIPNYYSLKNSNSELKVTPFQEKSRINAVFGSVSLGYKRMLFVELTDRNEWASTLPEGDQSYNYPSASASWIFSDLLDKKWLSYGKLRAGWSLTANAPRAFVAGATNPISSANFLGNATAIQPNVGNNSTLKPEKTRQWEIGTELSFFGRRASLDFSYYNTLSKDVILPVQQSGASGSTSKWINAAEISNKGIELALKGTPIKTKSGFEWGLGFNFGKNKNMVEKLFIADGDTTQSIRLANAPFSAVLEARPGYAYGQIVGYAFERDANGNKLTEDGFYLRTAKVQALGSVLPDYTGGFSTWLAYKGIRLNAQFDFQKGGKIFSMTNMWGKYSGTLAETAEGDIRENGLVVDGIAISGYDDNGNPISSGVSNTDTITAVDHFFANQGYVITEADVYDASFLKFRELSISYDLPTAWFSNAKFVQGISLGASARNIAILSKNVPNIDPEAGLSSGNIQGLEGAQLPTERTIGINVSVRF